MNGTRGRPWIVRYIISRYVHVFPLPFLFLPPLAFTFSSILGPLSYAKPSSAFHCGALWDREPRVQSTTPRLFPAISSASLQNPFSLSVTLFSSFPPSALLLSPSLAFYFALSNPPPPTCAQRGAFGIVFYFSPFLKIWLLVRRGRGEELGRTVPPFQRQR